MKTHTDIAPQTWWQKLSAWLNSLEAAMDFREIDGLSERIKNLERRIVALEVQLIDSNIYSSNSIHSVELLLHKTEKL